MNQGELKVEQSSDSWHSQVEFLLYCPFHSTQSGFRLAYSSEQEILNFSSYFDSASLRMDGLKPAWFRVEKLPMAARLNLAEKTMLEDKIDSNMINRERRHQEREAAMQLKTSQGE
eukprot:Gb_39424 [translate_table: standard]